MAQMKTRPWPRFFFVRSFVSRVAIKLKALRSIRFDNLLR